MFGSIFRRGRHKLQRAVCPIIQFEDAKDFPIAAKIRNAPLLTDPFPHIIVRDLLPPDVYADAMRHWPKPGALPPEPGELGRYLGHLIAGNRLYARWTLPTNRFWFSFSQTIGRALVAGVMDRFSELNGMRFGADAPYGASLSLFESGPNFEQHGAHTHHNHNPDFMWTFLLFLDDGGRTDRGELFSAPCSTSDWLDVVSAVAPTAPVKRIPFEPNTLLAWLDGPMSFHGTELLARDPVNRRKMLRCHTHVIEDVLRARLGVSTDEFDQACRAHKAGNSEALKTILARPNNCVESLPRFRFASLHPQRGQEHS